MNGCEVLQFARGMKRVMTDEDFSALDRAGLGVSPYF